MEKRGENVEDVNGDSGLHSDLESFCGKVLKQYRFSSFCNVLNSIERVRARRNERFHPLTRFWNKLSSDLHRICPRYRNLIHPDATYPALQLPPLVCCTLLKLFLPNADAQRTAYGIGERSLATLYIKIFVFPPQTESANRLSNFRDASKAGSGAGDLSLVFQSVLEKRGHVYGKSTSTKDRRSISLFEIDSLLKNLSTSTKASEREQFISDLVLRCSPNEAKWLTRLLLKHLQLSLSVESTLKWFHPNAPGIYVGCHNLYDTCIRCVQTQIGPELTISLDPGSPCSVQLLYPMQGEEAISRVVSSMNHPFILEPKLDGERMLLHKDGEKIQTFARSAFDSSERFAKYLRSCAVEGIRARRCILDGEVMLWNCHLSSFESFTKLRELPNLLQNQTPCDDGATGASSASTNYQIRFVAFDVLYYDGELNAMDDNRMSLTRDDFMVALLPLHKRKALLNEIVSKEMCLKHGGVIEVASCKEGNSRDDIMFAMERYVVDSHFEGVVVKDKQKAYTFGNRDFSVAAKLKPDYIGGGVRDLDAVLIGGWYGQGRRANVLSNFCFAILDEPVEGVGYLDRNEQLVYFGSVSNGFSYSDLESISNEYAPYIEPCEKESGRDRTRGNYWIPKYLKHEQFIADQVPDFWLNDLDKAIVVTLKGYELLHKPSSAAGYSLRFPRVEEIRTDKKWTQCNTVSDVFTIATSAVSKGILKNNNKASDKSGSEEDIGHQYTAGFESRKRKESHQNVETHKKRQAMKRKRTERIIIGSSQAIDPDTVAKRSAVFQGLEFNVMSTGLFLQKQIQELERKLIEHGALVSDEVTNSVDYIVAFCSSAKSVSVDQWIKYCKQIEGKEGKELEKVYKENLGGIRSVLSTEWVERCIEENQIVEAYSDEYIWACPNDEKRLGELEDEFGDSWTFPIDANNPKHVARLKRALERAMKVESKVLEIEKEMEYLESEFRMNVFWKCTFALDCDQMIAPVMKGMIEMHGGTCVSKDHLREASHVLVSAESVNNFALFSSQKILTPESLLAQIAQEQSRFQRECK